MRIGLIQRMTALVAAAATMAINAWSPAMIPAQTSDAMAVGLAGGMAMAMTMGMPIGMEMGLPLGRHSWPLSTP
jgi:hypothetical protein